ncbi:vWA domain-containing protein [uncultured Sphingomonas sp.]|uniref:vWA domain-containing protein n=1 Tax=uncultured Sphingomonas sp. TaxID=158754 RepID=UPI0035CB6F79
MSSAEDTTAVPATAGEDLAPEASPLVPTDPATEGAAVPSTEPLEGAPVESLPGDQGVAGIAAASLAPQARGKTKGVADIVFVVDVSGSMVPCIDALRQNIETFVSSLSGGDANNAPPVKDWRAKVVGYRDLESSEAEGLPWMIDNEFVRDTAALKTQLGGLSANGGGDEPESLLDVLYKVATMEASPKGSQTVEATKWRYRSDAARVVVVFTDASFKETMSIPEAKGGSLQDVANVVMANRIILSVFAPNFEGYDRLSQIDKSEWEVVEFEGLNAQEALTKFTSDPVNFRNTLKQLAASVSRSAETVAL